jgi:hypothetical protein
MELNFILTKCADVGNIKSQLSFEIMWIMSGHKLFPFFFFFFFWVHASFLLLVGSLLSLFLQILCKILMWIFNTCIHISYHRVWNCCLSSCSYPGYPMFHVHIRDTTKHVGYYIDPHLICLFEGHLNTHVITECRNWKKLIPVPNWYVKMDIPTQHGYIHHQCLHVQGWEFMGQL